MIVKQDALLGALPDLPGPVHRQGHERKHLLRVSDAQRDFLLTGLWKEQEIPRWRRERKTAFLEGTSRCGGQGVGVLNQRQIALQDACCVRPGNLMRAVTQPGFGRSLQAGPPPTADSSIYYACFLRFKSQTEAPIPAPAAGQSS